MEYNRRNRLDKNEPAQLAIYEAMRAVEKMPADVRLTRAVVLLSEAMDLVADFIDETKVYRITTQKNMPVLEKDGCTYELSTTLSRKWTLEEPRRYRLGNGPDCMYWDVVRGKDFRLLGNIAYDMDEI